MDDAEESGSTHADGASCTRSESCVEGTLPCLMQSLLVAFSGLVDSSSKQKGSIFVTGLADTVMPKDFDV